MADEADMAQIEIESYNVNTRASRFQFDLPSLKECIMCETPIPLARRQIGGVTRCIDCQTIFDRRNR